VRDYCSRESFRSCARALCDALTKSGGRALERVRVEEPPQRMCVRGRLSPTGCPDRIRTCPVRRLTRSRYSILILATLTMANVSQSFLFLLCAAMASEVSFLNC
jgi:hypothetical protein